MENELDDSHSLEVYTGNLSTPGIIDKLISCVGVDGFNCVEMLGSTSLRIYFKKPESVEKVLQEPFVIGDRELCFFRVGEKVRTVFVKGLPFNLPEKFIYNTLSKYGRVRNIGYERHAGYKPLCTGTRVVKMAFDTPLPNFLRIDKFMSVIAYSRQVIICRRCGGSDGHLAKVCKASREQFRPGYPIHTRPIAPRLGNLGARRRTSTAVQTVGKTANDTVAASKQNKKSTKASRKAAALARRLNGLRLEVLDECSEPGSGQTKTSASLEASRKNSRNDAKEISRAAGKAVKQVGACAKDATSEPTGDAGTVPIVTETSEPVTAAKKKKNRRRKKKTNQQ